MLDQQRKHYLCQASHIPDRVLYWILTLLFLSFLLCCGVRHHLLSGDSFVAHLSLKEEGWGTTNAGFSTALIGAATCSASGHTAGKICGREGSRAAVGM